MKKQIAVLMILLLVLSLFSACGPANVSPPTLAPTEAPAETRAPAATPEPTPELTMSKTVK